MHIENVTIEGVEHLQIKKDDQILLSVVPAHGARLTSLQFPVAEGYKETLWEVTPEDCKTGAWSKNEILFPWPNRIDGGKYSFNGKTYQLPINEVANNNALHGMVTQANFLVEKSIVDGDKAEIVLLTEYDGKQEYYTFPFTLKVIYTYTLPGEFTISFEAVNIGSESLPFGLGWHPYFKFDATLDKLTLDIPETDHLLLGERMIPNGQEENFEHTSLKLSDWALDDCFRIKGDECFCTLKDENLTLKMSGSPEWNYLQLFTPEGFGTVAVEPMTSGVNVFNNEEGLRLLKPEEIFQVSFKITV